MDSGLTYQNTRNKLSLCGKLLLEEIVVCDLVFFCC